MVYLGGELDLDFGSFSDRTRILGLLEVKMRLTATQAALLLAIMVTRSEQTRARVSAKTLKVISHRERLHSSFVQDVRDDLEVNYRLIMFEIDSGGYGIVAAKAVEAAKPLTAKKWISEVERSSIRNGIVDWERLEAEIPNDIDQPEDDGE